ncbi:MAG: hypothetical protein GC204_07550 [Chloroflexi bacterium]|nr:hypothetical protein [Chloroflexota bacterium]
MSRLLVAYGVFLPVFGIMMIIIVILGIRDRRWQVYVGAGWAALLLTAVFVLGFVFKWFPDTPPDTCSDGQPCFCEGYQGNSTTVTQPDGTVVIQTDPNTVILQPESFWSDLSFMVVGLLILYLAAKPNATPANPMEDPKSGFPLMLGLIVIFMGPGSMLYHASIKSWGGWFDSMSIMFWMIFSLAYSITRLLRLQWGWFALMWSVPVVIIGLVDIIPEARQVGYFVFGGAWGVLDLIVAIRSMQNQTTGGVLRHPGWYAVTLGTFAFSMLGFWIFSGGGTTSLCPTDSFFQPHAVFHILSACVALFGFTYFATETRTAA